MNRYAPTWVTGLLLAAPLALLAPVAARAGVRIGIDLVPPVFIPPPVYYGPPPEYYRPPPPVYYGPGVIYGDRRWNYGGEGRDRGWDPDRWHGQGRRDDRGREHDGGDRRDHH